MSMCEWQCCWRRHDSIRCAIFVMLLSVATVSRRRPASAGMCSENGHVLEHEKGASCTTVLTETLRVHIQITVRWSVDLRNTSRYRNSGRTNVPLYDISVTFPICIYELSFHTHKSEAMQQYSHLKTTLSHVRHLNTDVWLNLWLKVLFLKQLLSIALWRLYNWNRRKFFAKFKVGKMFIIWTVPKLDSSSTRNSTAGRCDLLILLLITIGGEFWEQFRKHCSKCASP
jgi:hypothetical protein